MQFPYPYQQPRIIPGMYLQYPPIYQPRMVYDFSFRPYPPVDTSMFTKSAEEMHRLMEKAEKLMEKLRNSQKFAQDVMAAAQVNDSNEVDRLLKTTGIESEMKAEYNPDGLKIKLTSSTNNIECCHLTVSLRW